MDSSDMSADLSKEELVKRLLDQVNSLKSEDILKMMSAVQSTSAVESATSVREEKDEVGTSAPYDSNQDMNKQPPLLNVKPENKKITENPGNTKIYKRRVGTTDSGRDYEFKMLTLLCIRCVMKKTEDMWMVTNADDVGDFDDIILHQKTKGSPGVTYMIQMKHKEAGSEITQADFTHRGKPFNLIKHAQGFSKLKETLVNTTRSGDVIENIDPDKILSVFFTNRIAANGIPYFEECSNEDLMLLNTSAKHKHLYKFNITAGDALGLANLDYCGNIYFLSNQVNEADVDCCIFEEMQSLIKELGLTKVNGRNIAKYFTEYVTKWAKCKLGDAQYLTKEQVLYKLTDLFLSEYSVKFNNEPCAFYDCPTKHIWNRIVDDRIITYVAFDSVSYTFLKEYVGSEVKQYHVKLENKWASRLSDRNKKSFFDKNSNLKTIIGTHGIPTMLDVYKCLWLNYKIPLLLEVNSKKDHQNILSILEWSKLYLKIIIVNKVDLIDTKANFVSLNDLNEESRRIILEQFVSLQGRKGHKLGELVKEPMYKFVKCNDIIRILSGSYNIGNVYSSIDKYFVDRSVYRILVEFEALLQINDEIFVIRNEAPEGLLINKLESLNVNPNGSNIIVAQDLSSKELKKLKSKHGAIHRLIFNGEDWLEWVQSLGTTEGIKKHLIPLHVSHSINFLDQIRNDVTNSTLNKTRVFSGSPGMGKSTLIDFISNEAPSHMWVLKISLNDYTEYYENAHFKKASDHIKYFNEQIINNGSCFNIPLAKAVFQKLLTENKILVFLDGFDEVSVSYKDEATKIMKSLHEGVHHMWISTRPHMTSHLEEEFDTIAIAITPFTLQNQQNFFLKYFTELIKNSKTYERRRHINKFSKTLLKAAEKNLNDWDHEFMEIPLQCKLLADFFIDDLKASLSQDVINLNEDFNLLQLYEDFINKKRNILCNKYGKCAKEMHKFFDCYQKLLALKILFRKSDLCELDIDLELNDYYQNKKNCMEILQREGVLIVHKRKQTFSAMFVHRTFAEFIAAQWLVENYNTTNSKIKNTVEFLLSTRFFGDGSDRKFLFRIFDSLSAKGFPLHSAVINKQIPQIKEMLTSSPKDINEFDECQRSVLHLIALYFDTIVLDQIETMPSGLYENDSFGYNPLDYAILCYHLTVVDKLCEKSNEMITVAISEGHRFVFDINSKVYEFALSKTFQYLVWKCLERDLDDNLSFLFDSIRDKDLSSLRKLDVITTTDLIEKFNIKSTTENYYFDLRFAAAFGTFINVKQLLAEGADVNQRVFGYTPLYCAVKKNQPEIVEILLCERAEANAVCVGGSTALHAASEAGYGNLVDMLIKSGANVNKRNIFGKTPLFLASEKHYVNIVNLLLRHEADVNIINNEGNTCLHVAAEKGFHKLIQCGADVNISDANGKTPLFLALENRQTDVATLLIEHDVEADITDHHGNSYLHAAATVGRSDILLHFIQKGLDVKQYNEKGETPLYLALKNKRIDTIKILLEHNRELDDFDVDTQGNSNLHLAVLIEDIDIVDCLIRKGFDVNKKNNNGETALQLAQNCKNLSIAKLLYESGANMNEMEFQRFCVGIEVISGNNRPLYEYLQNGFDVDLKDKDNKTLLFTAVECGNIAAASLLLENNADMDIDNTYLHNTIKFPNHLQKLMEEYEINVTSNFLKTHRLDKEGKTSLWLAVEKGYTDIVKLLLENNIRLDYVDHHDNSYLHAAAIAGEIDIIRLLIEKGLDINKQNKNGETPLFYALKNGHSKAAKFLLDNKAKVDSAGYWYDSCLHFAAKLGETDIVSHIINEDFNINLENFVGETPLSLALENGHVSVAELLLKNNAKIDGVDRDGNTCLHAAAKADQSHIVRQLINAGLAVDKQNKEGETPLLIAFKHGYLDVVKTLISCDLNFNLRTKFNGHHLEYATRSGCLEDWIQFVLNNNYTNTNDQECDITAVNESNQTLLHISVYKIYPKSIAKLQHHEGTVKFLLNSGIDVNKKDNEERTVLHYISNYNMLSKGIYTEDFYKNVATLILNTNIDINAKDKQGQTALDLATENEHYKIASLIRQQLDNVKY